MPSKEQAPTPTRGVAVDLDCRRYLRYPLKVLKSLQAEGAAASLGQILFLGLKTDDPELTLDFVESLIDLESLPTLFGPVKKATGGLIDLSRVFEDMVEKDPQPPAPAEIGRASCRETV